MVSLAIWLASVLFVGLVVFYALCLLLWAIGSLLSGLVGIGLDVGGLFVNEEKRQAERLAQLEAKRAAHRGEAGERRRQRLAGDYVPHDCRYDDCGPDCHLMDYP
jgi:hypothetical protein